MGHQSALCRAGFLLLFPLVFAAAHAQDTVVLGPIEQVSKTGSSLTVLGQTFELSSALTVTVGAKRFTRSDALRLVRPGIYVSVVGKERPNGLPVAQEIVVSRLAYVPGASDIFVSGLITSYDASTGQ